MIDNTFDLNGVRVPKPAAATTDGSRPNRITVCRFTVVVSNNEVTHAMDYTFDNIRDGDGMLVVPTVSRHLKTGDYAIDGMEERCCVERKQLSDLYMCCGSDRERFSREIERMAEMEVAFVAIEADWREIANPEEFRIGWQSRTNPRSVVGTINAWSIRYPRVHWLACGSRREAEVRTFQILQAAWKEWHGKAGTTG